MNNELKFDMRLLERLCLANGVSGYEDEVRAMIADEIKAYCDELYIDVLGNLIAFKKGKRRAPKRLMLCAHMDEVGFAVKYVNDDGTLSFDEVGMNAAVMPSKRVTVGEDRIKGVIGSPPVHLSRDSGKTLSASDLRIDIGAKDAHDVQELDLLGAYAAFESDFCLFGDGLVKSKALDDRIGCAVMCLLLKKELPYDAYFGFTVGEELGGVGAGAAAESINPDICLVLEGTTASDISGTPEKDVVCRVGFGPVCPFMDGGTLYDEKLYTGIRKLAEREGLPCQTKEKIAGGTDGARIQRSANGIRTAALSLPCRYIHTPSSVAAADDMENMYRLTWELMTEIYFM